MITRRKFLQRSSLLATTLAAGKSRLLHGVAQTHGVATMAPALDVNTLPQFVDPLPIPELARRQGTRPSPSDPKQAVPFYRVQAQPISSKVHRDLPPTKFWSFGRSTPGPTIETRSGEPLLVEWVNALPNEHFLPVDHTIHGAEADKPAVRTVVHLHGAKTGPESDGYPEDWIVPGKSSFYYYPNQQDAATLWYHDHALGINRLNVYAGLFGTFLIRDSVEDALNLPKGKYEVPLAVYDRLLTRDAQLLYPVSPDPQSPWIPELSGNAILVNGKLFPYLEVEPRRYRFRILNASNARFYNLSLLGKTSDERSSDSKSSDGHATLHQIGTDQGLLPAPVPLTSLQIAPGERADLVIDFSEHRGEQLILRNDAFVVMQFRVSAAKVTDTSSLPSTLRPVPRIPESQAVQTRLLTLDEYVKSGNPVMLLLNASHWSLPVTEKPVLGSTEIWTLINPTNDSHPIHLHLVRFQILDRQSYEPWLFQTKRQLHFLGPPQPPDPNEAGWKDTVRADSRMVTRIIVPFTGYTGRYVWHCHILEHEDNEMMRPYDVVAAP